MFVPPWTRTTSVVDEYADAMEWIIVSNGVAEEKRVVADVLPNEVAPVTVSE